MIRVFREPPPWFTGWIPVICMLVIGSPILYYGFRYTQEDHEKSKNDLPFFLKIAPWWVTKVFFLAIGLVVLFTGIGYSYNVILFPDE